MSKLTIEQITTIAEMHQIKETGKIKPSDEQNPAYLFKSTVTDQLCLIATRKIDAKERQSLHWKTEVQTSKANG